MRKNHLLIYTAIALLILSVLIIILTNRTLSYQEQSIKFTIVATNDIHGNFYGKSLIKQDNKFKYTQGGLQVMAHLIQILKNQNPLYFLYLDAGDQFQGGFQSSKQVSSGQIMTDYFNHIHLSASTIGNHQFDFGKQFLEKYLKKLNSKILSANLINKKYQYNNPLYYPLHNQRPSTIFQYQIKQQLKIKHNINNLKIGVIGLSTIETIYTTSGFTSSLFPKSYKFLKYKRVIIKQVKKLKQNKVNAIILVSHIGNNCGHNINYGIWSQNNMGNINTCNKNDQIFKLIDQLPLNTIDFVIQGHRHSTSHYFYKGIPIVGTVKDGLYFNAIHLEFFIKHGSISLNKKYTKIQGPIPVCEKIFENTKNCEYQQLQNLNKVGNLVRWKFHDIQVQRDNQLSQLVKNKWGQIMKKYQVQIAYSFISQPLYSKNQANFKLGNLITNLVSNFLNRNKYNFNFIILNSGMFRTTWYPGIIKYENIHQMIPFDNKLTFIDMQGQNIKKMMQTLQNGGMGYYPSWGICQTFKKQQINYYKLINLILANGSPIYDNQVYTFVTSNFLSGGGDNFKSLTRYFLKTDVKNILLKQIIKQQLVKLKQITQKNLQNPTNLQRLIIIQ